MTDTVLITGASEGIGKATALKFAKHGYNIVMAARHADCLEAAANEVRSLGRDALTVPTDVRDPAQVEQLVQQAIAHFGEIDVLVNNAGIWFLGSVESASLEDWHTIIDTNVWGYIHLIHALLPHFLQRKQGMIVNVSSIGGITPIPYQVPYTTSKYAVTGLSQSLQAELKPKGIQVCGIYPSFIRSQVLERAVIRGNSAETESDRREMVEKSIQLPMIEKPEDVANAIYDAVVHRRSDVTVGSAKLFTTLFRVLPGVMKASIRQAFGMKEKEA